MEIELYIQQAGKQALQVQLGAQAAPDEVVDQCYGGLLGHLYAFARQVGLYLHD